MADWTYEALFFSPAGAPPVEALYETLDVRWQTDAP
jgi:hypothetical protein